MNAAIPTFSELSLSMFHHTLHQNQMKLYCGEIANRPQWGAAGQLDFSLYMAMTVSPSCLPCQSDRLRCGGEPKLMRLKQLYKRSIKYTGNRRSHSVCVAFLFSGCFKWPTILIEEKPKHRYWGENEVTAVIY